MQSRDSSDTKSKIDLILEKILTDAPNIKVSFFYLANKSHFSMGWWVRYLPDEGEGYAFTVGFYLN